MYIKYKELKMINYQNPHKKNYMNKIRSSQAMSSGWNRKERYMIEKDNMMRHIKFLSYWIKTMIRLSTFIITKKDTNSRSRGKFIVFYKRTKRNKYNKKLQRINSQGHTYTTFQKEKNMKYEKIKLY
jgi:hypothetical protein